ncbi:MAG TPA: hypothetical protein VL418_17450 [Devosiaceae bacterium]|nr:hypothetical protein [Devosiaceae bacterium]
MDEFIEAGKPLRKLQSAVPLEGRAVEVTWRGGDVEAIDLMPALLSHRSFVRLRTDDALFHELSVSEFGDALEWPDGSELAAAWIDELRPIEFDNADFRAAMDVLDLSLDGMAARLRIARRLVADYRKDKPIPATVALAVQYLVEKRRKAG